MLRVLLLLAVAGTVQAQSPSAKAPVVALKRGMVITRSVRIAPALYRLDSRSTDSAAITVRGDNITIDFNGAVLWGMNPSADPDAAAGLGIRIEGGRNVRVINAKVHGYKVGLLARGTKGLKIESGDFSYNWKPRLYSVIEHESLVDWLSHHKNEQDEWLRFGAGIYLSDVRGGELRGNRIEQGMEGVMLVRCDSLLIWNNTIEYNSGVGIGMYRSTDNRIMHNHASFNVRGFSRYYRRGQDSADLLMYEQSSRNIVAFNDMTHGGDGLFLWAGQSTMDTGKGGANDNIFYANDFSYAPTNAMEATFSRNTFIGNEANGSEYGLWGGYSYESKVLGNSFMGNRTGLAIEHGQSNIIGGNFFTGDTTAIYLWGNPIEPSDWGYPKYRDTRSRDYEIIGNQFSDARVAMRINTTVNAAFTNNRVLTTDTLIASRDTSRVVQSGNDTSRMHAATLADREGNRRRDVALDAALTAGMPQRLAGGYPIRSGKPVRNAIIVDEWGPYSWQYPRLWPVDSTRALPIKLLVLGPPGEWRVVSGRGIATLSSTGGSIAVMNAQNPLAARDTLVVTPASNAERDWEVVLEYRGAATVSSRGVKLPAGTARRFSYSRFEPIAGWDVAFHIWPDSADPRTKGDAFSALLRSTPLMTRREQRLDYMWYGPAIKGIPQAKWAAVATTTVDLPAGATPYTLRLISDDGGRVYVDGRLVIDAWTPHESAVGNARLSAGHHDIRVEYYQIDGWSELRVDIVRGVQTSTGSAGPH